MHGLCKLIKKSVGHSERMSYVPLSNLIQRDLLKLLTQFLLLGHPSLYYRLVYICSRQLVRKRHPEIIAPKHPVGRVGSKRDPQFGVSSNFTAVGRHSSHRKKRLHADRAHPS